MKFEDIDAYMHRITPRRDPVPARMEAYARRHGFPIIGPLVGRFLFQTAVMKEATSVLELGSGFGYSAYWFGMAMGKKGHIVMTDMSEENRIRALAYLKKAGIRSKITYHLGDSVEIAKKLSGKFDIILNDIDKHGYPETIEPAARLLKKGGVFITDNTIWSGRVFDSRVKDKNTRGIRTFTKLLYADTRFYTTLLPIRDGIAVALRR